MQTTVDQNVIEKIKKLLDHHAGCLKINSEQEAFSALELAKSLMKKHHLDMMQFSEMIYEEDVTHKKIDKCSVYSVPLWMLNLINVINNICNCSCVLEKSKQSNGYIHINIVFVTLKTEIEKVENMYSFLKKTTYRLANSHVKQIHGNYTNWRSFSEGFTSRLLERSRLFSKTSETDNNDNQPFDANEFDYNDFEESEEDDDIEDFEEFENEEDEFKQELDIPKKESNKKCDSVDIQLYEYLKDVKKKIENYISKNMSNTQYENINRKSKVLLDSYEIGRKQADSTNLTYTDKKHQLTQQKTTKRNKQNG